MNFEVRYLNVTDNDYTLTPECNNWFLTVIKFSYHASISYIYTSIDYHCFSNVTVPKIAVPICCADKYEVCLLMHRSIQDEA